MGTVCPRIKNAASLYSPAFALSVQEEAFDCLVLLLLRCAHAVSTVISTSGVMISYGTPLRKGCLWTFLAAALVGVIITGAVFGGLTLYQTYGHAFARLAARDVQLSQELYSDTVARQLKDMLLQQQEDQLNAELAADSMTRETAARIAEEDIIAGDLANETAARTAIDIFFAAEIANLTNAVIVAEQYEVFSKATFLSLILNITNLQTVLFNEIAARIAGDALLTEQGALSDAAIAYLTTTLEHDIHDRMVQDVLINEWIAALDAIGKGIESINGQTGSIRNDVDIISTNVLTTITAPAPGTLLFTNNAIVTMEGVGAAAGGNIVLEGGTGVNVVANGPHGLHISTPYAPIGPNSVTIAGSTATEFNFDGNINDWIYVGCFFQDYNTGGGGFGTCGWSAPDSSTYIVQVSAQLTICPSQVGGIYPSANHINMAFARTNLDYALAHAAVDTENTGGVLDLVAGSYVGNGQLPPNSYCIDLAMSATTVVQGAGVAGSGGLASGYGVFVFFQGTIQGIRAQPVSVTYLVTKVA